MASLYKITIAGVDRTGDVINRSVKIEDILNDQQNKCGFDLIDRSNLGIPDLEDEVKIYDVEGNIIFGGYIIKIDKDKSATGVLACQIECTDYSRILDRFLVHRAFEDMTDKEIIQEIINVYCVGLGITTTNVIEGVTIEKIKFNYIQISQVLKNICKLTNRNWYIDYNKDIHYFPLDTNVSPFNIDDNSTNYRNLSLSLDSSQLKNRVYVRGGSKLSDFTDYITAGDGETRKFVLPDKPHDCTIYVDTGSGYVEKTVGIKNIDTSGFDWYLNYQEKYIEQDSEGSVLTANHKIKLNYKYDIPILVAVEDTQSIEDNGVQEFAIFDNTIATTEIARNRAQAELTDYANELIEGSFDTMTTGFKAGQYININLTDYGVNADYIIKSVSSTSLGGGLFTYQIKIASAKTLGIIAFLISLLEQNRNLIELDDDEVIDELLEKSDLLLNDSLLDALTIDSAGPYFTWCDSTETSPTTRMRWDLFSWG